MAQVYPAQFAQFSIDEPAKAHDQWTVKVRGPGNFLCRSSVLAENNIVSLTYEPRFPGVHNVWIERNGVSLLEGKQITFTPDTSTDGKSKSKSKPKDKKEKKKDRESVLGEDDDGLPVRVSTEPPTVIHVPPPHTAKPRKSSLKKSSSTGAPPPEPKEIKRQMSQPAEMFAQQRTPILQPRRISETKIAPAAEPTTKFQRSSSSSAKVSQALPSPSSSSKTSSKSPRPSAESISSPISKCVVCRKPLYPEQQNLFQGRPYCIADFRQLFPTVETRQDLSSQPTQPDLVRRDRPPPMRQEDHRIPKRQAREVDAFIGLSESELRSAVKLFRLCRSYKLGQIRDEDCLQTMRQALSAKFNCDFPVAINIAIEDTMENTTFISPVTIAEKEFLSMFAHLVRYILLSERGVDVHQVEDQHRRERARRIHEKAISEPRSPPLRITDGDNDSRVDGDRVSAAASSLVSDSLFDPASEKRGRYSPPPNKSKPTNGVRVLPEKTSKKTSDQDQESAELSLSVSETASGTKPVVSEAVPPPATKRRVDPTFG